MAHMFGWQPGDMGSLLPEELEQGLEYLREMRRDGDT